MDLKKWSKFPQITKLPHKTRIFGFRPHISPTICYPWLFLWSPGFGQPCQFFMMFIFTSRRISRVNVENFSRIRRVTGLEFLTRGNTDIFYCYAHFFLFDDSKLLSFFCCFYDLFRFMTMAIARGILKLFFLENSEE